GERFLMSKSMQTRASNLASSLDVKSAHDGTYVSFLERKQQGVALVSVLLIFALIAVLATGMINRQRLQINQSINVIGQNQAYQIALGAEMLAMWSLNKDYMEDKRQNKFIDTDQELSRSIVYAELNPPFSVEGQ